MTPDALEFEHVKAMTLLNSAGGDYAAARLLESYFFDVPPAIRDELLLDEVASMVEHMTDEQLADYRRRCAFASMDRLP